MHTGLWQRFGNVHGRRHAESALEHVEVDEIWTFVQKKQARLTIDERHDIGDVYLWTALEKSWSA